MNLLLQGEKQDVAACRQELFKIESYVEMALNYLRFEEMSNDLVLERNSLEQLVRQVVKKYAAIFIYNHISIQLEHLDYTVLTDEKWFCFVLEQILSNALKYTKQGSVKISTEESANGLKILVQDTGIGIRKEDLPRIFEKVLPDIMAGWIRRRAVLDFICAKACVRSLDMGFLWLRKREMERL